jgi:malate dehydrogenase (oxaloacetate-decarboxylating)(NADP+)
MHLPPKMALPTTPIKAITFTFSLASALAAALAGSLNAEEIQRGLIYPKIERVRDASVIVAREVMKSARRAGVSMVPEAQWIEWEEWGDVELERWIKAQVYDPKW